MARGSGTKPPPAKIEPKFNPNKEDYSYIKVKTRVKGMTIEQAVKEYVRVQKIGDNRTREENKIYYWTYRKLWDKKMLKGTQVKPELL